MDWSLFIRQNLINGGDISKKYGSYMEGLIEAVFRERGWSIIARGHKIKEKNNTVTDCDLITYKNGLLLLIQIKSSSKGKSPYDNWCVKNTIKKGVEQCKKCIEKFNLDDENIKDLIKNKGINIESIDNIQAVVVTPNYHFNGINIEDIPIINFGYLISLLNGAKIELINEDFEIIKTSNPYLDECWNSNEFIDLIRNPFDWKLDMDEYKIKYDKIDLNYLTVIKPMISENTVKFY